MAKKTQKLKKAASGLAQVGKMASDVVGIAESVNSLSTLATPVVEHVIENRKSLITIPELYSEDFSLSLEQAKELLNHYGLTTMDVELSIKDAKSEYRNCFVSQVVDSRPAQKQNVKPGTMVVLRYVTSEVIEESQRLFEEYQNIKKEMENKKALKRLEQKEKTKKMLLETVSKAKSDVNKILTRRNDTNKKICNTMEETDNE